MERGNAEGTKAGATLKTYLTEFEKTVEEALSRYQGLDSLPDQVADIVKVRDYLTLLGGG
jgi:hypothetical protein